MAALKTRCRRPRASRSCGKAPLSRATPTSPPNSPASAGSGAEALIVHATPGEGAPLTVQFRDLGLNIPIVHNHGIGNQAFIDLAGGRGRGRALPHRQAAGGG